MGGKTYTLTSTDTDTTKTVTDDVFVTSTGLPAETSPAATSPAQGFACRTKVDLVSSFTFGIAAIVFVLLF